MRKRFSVILAAIGLAASAAAQAVVTNVENAYETSASHVSLPSIAHGQLVITECAGCKAVVLHVDEGTLFLVGGLRGQAVSLTEMRQALRAPGADKRLLMIFYQLDNNVVTRVVLSAG